MEEQRDIIYIYADGGVRDNQSSTNVGAWGSVIRFNGIEKCFSGSEKNTTNNRMELQSAINGLEKINPNDYPIVVVMDSEYVVAGITRWIGKWLMMGWKTSRGLPVKNQELWQQLLTQKMRFKNIRFERVAGHSTNEGNNKADLLCNQEMDKAKNNL